MNTAIGRALQRSKVRSSVAVRVPAASRRRRHLAIAFAAASDALQWALFPVTVEGVLSPVEIAIDVGTAVVLLLILGFRWRLAAAFAVELIPGADLFPTWTAAVLSMAASTEPALPHPPRAPQAASTRW